MCHLHDHLLHVNLAGWGATTTLGAFGVAETLFSTGVAPKNTVELRDTATIVPMVVAGDGGIHTPGLEAGGTRQLGCRFWRSGPF